jgi:S-adenosylmethionine-diacylglycerol 3-amino-3-carboxypropyl transferase
LSLRPRLRDACDELLEANSVEQQREIYAVRVAPVLWTRPVKWALSRQFTLSLLGVPHPQRKEVQRQHEGGVAGFVREAIEYVICQLPIWTNYFWTLYLRGRYTTANCPEYLKRENFSALKAGLVDRIVISTETVTQFLKRTEEQISRFVLLDHMDWMSSYQPVALAEEWNAILDRATRNARLIFRSAHSSPDYLRTVHTGEGANRKPIVESLRFHPELARRLHIQDRVHTYAGFHIADVCA